MGLQYTTVANTEIAFFHHAPTVHARASLTMLHGLGEYAGRYDHVIAALNAVGIGVTAVEFFGHGDSKGRKGDVPSYDAGLNLIEAALVKSHEQFPNEPQFLFGHSMGGNFVVNYVLRRKPKLAGVILSAPWLRAAIKPTALQNFMAKAGLMLMPSLTQPTNLNPNHISRIPEEAARYANDPKIFDALSARLYDGVVKAGEWALEHAAEWNLPVYHYHGDADPIISFAASQAFAEKVSPDLMTFKGWPGGYHEVHQDIDQDRVVETLVQWVVKHS